eukprot:1725501-Prymnesium_polylepis.1
MSRNCERHHLLRACGEKTALHELDAAKVSTAVAFRTHVGRVLSYKSLLGSLGGIRPFSNA